MFALLCCMIALGSEPTEYEKARQEAIDMGIDPAVLDALEKSAEQTVKIVEGVHEVNARLGMVSEALASRADVEACDAEAQKRAGSPVTGELVLAVTVGKAGVVDVKETRRDSAVDADLSACVSAVVKGLKLPEDTAPSTNEVVVRFPYAAAKP